MKNEMRENCGLEPYLGPMYQEMKSAISIRCLKCGYSEDTSVLQCDGPTAKVVIGDFCERHKKGCNCTLGDIEILDLSNFRLLRSK